MQAPLFDTADKLAAHPSSSILGPHVPALEMAVETGECLVDGCLGKTERNSGVVDRQETDFVGWLPVQAIPSGNPARADVEARPIFSDPSVLLRGFSSIWAPTKRKSGLLLLITTRYNHGFQHSVFPGQSHLYVKSFLLRKPIHSTTILPIPETGIVLFPCA